MSRLTRASIDHWIAHYVLPLGLLILLTGMFWIGSKSGLHKAYYALFAFPVAVLLVTQPSRLITLGGNPIFIGFLVFSAYTLLSIAWSDTDTPASSLIKRPFYVALLFLGVAFLAQRERDRLLHVLSIATLLAAISALGSIAYFLIQGAEGRLSGYGALENPLLTSHVYGMFAAVALATIFVRHDRWPITIAVFLCLSALILLTGSRTPLAGLTMASLWFLAIRGEKRGRWIFFALAVSAACIVALYPEAILNRGLSYRPEIWYQSALQIAERPWFGYGYDSPMSFCVAELDQCFTDPHNLVLAVVDRGGLIGGVLWLGLLLGALGYAWKERRSSLVAVFSTTLVFGITAGLTEGESFLSRPKEHWFLIWIPLALLAAALDLARKRTDGTGE